MAIELTNYSALVSVTMIVIITDDIHNINFISYTAGPIHDFVEGIAPGFNAVGMSRRNVCNHMNFLPCILS